MKVKLNLGVPNDFQQILIHIFFSLPFHDADVSDINCCRDVFQGRCNSVHRHVFCSGLLFHRKGILQLSEE